MTIDKLAVQKVLDDFGAEVVRQSKLNLGTKRNGKVIDSSGKLRKSMNYKVTVNPNSFSFEIVMEEYGEWVDKGREKGSFPNVDAIKKWIKQKPIRLRDLKTGSFIKTSESKMNGLAYVIGRKIEKHGIAATNFLSEPFDKAFKELPNDLLEAFGLSVSKFIDSSLNELNKAYK